MALTIDSKRQLILDCESNLLVIGGPGCGKTTIALAKAYKYLQEKDLNRGQKVLFLSFSRNARTRILQSAEDFPEYKKFGRKLYVQTFHAFFLEIIKTHCYLLGTPKKINIVPPHDEDALKGSRKNDDKTWIEEKENQFYSEGKIVFDKFSEVALQLISKSKRIHNTLSKTFPLIIVDEAQDTDTEQWEFVKKFNAHSQLLLLGDLDQQIFDYREDINPERINDIKNELSPLEITLQSENYRSPNTEILQFAKDILKNTPRPSNYKGVTTLIYPPQADKRDIWIRKSIGILIKQIKKETGATPKSIAILCPWAKGVKMISNALRSNEIPHRVQFDETSTNLSSRMIACLMEPIIDNKQHLLFLLHILKDFSNAKGSVNDFKKYSSWIDKTQTNTNIAGKIIPYLKLLIEEIRNTKLTGNPARDWKFIQYKLLSCELSEIKSFISHSEFLIAYNRGKVIMRDLTRTWVEYGAYIDARGVLQRAIIEAQISSDTLSEDGINVMTTYKSKGKEFDGVIIFQNEYTAPLELRGDDENLKRSRKLFLVGVTRARHHVFILRQAGVSSKLLDNFNLGRLADL